MRFSRQRTPQRRAFIQTIASASLVVAGCGSQVQVSSGNGTAGSGGSSTNASSSSSSSGGGQCNPPPCKATCPETIPKNGSPCNPMGGSGGNPGEFDGSCPYVDPVCGDSIEAVCDPDTGTWQVPIVSCNPPPPSASCSAYMSEADCGVDSSCRWLVPGCSAPALPKAGCFKKQPCIDSPDCDLPFETCEEVVFDPCHNKSCDACAEATKVCLPI
jgi:hypothetical protein